eukprot:TRINITY_DN324_c0_g2_i1.p1 TRINITY_DN324_c0_g2~~TRINITY_DN324_c0_g2_i1.p1  ORF type:complete len:188 (+),score=77.93 TRINITY_DN324_c0_g2_i1:76-564(+)
MEYHLEEQEVTHGYLDMMGDTYIASQMASETEDEVRTMLEGMSLLNPSWSDEWLEKAEQEKEEEQLFRATHAKTDNHFGEEIRLLSDHVGGRKKRLDEESEDEDQDEDDEPQFGSEQSSSTANTEKDVKEGKGDQEKGKAKQVEEESIFSSVFSFFGGDENG